jgi:hypothetical protein
MTCKQTQVWSVVSPYSDWQDLLQELQRLHELGATYFSLELYWWLLSEVVCWFVSLWPVGGAREIKGMTRSYHGYHTAQRNS